MKKITSFITKILFVITGCLMFASFSPSLDGRAVVVDEGVFPKGYFAKTVGYLPGDIISVASISGDAPIDILVIGALDPSEGVAIMLSPEAADAIGIDKSANNIVKITKRSGQEEREYGRAVVAKKNPLEKDFTDEEEQEFDTTIENQDEEDFDDSNADMPDETDSLFDTTMTDTDRSESDENNTPMSDIDDSIPSMTDTDRSFDSSEDDFTDENSVFDDEDDFEDAELDADVEEDDSFDDEVFDDETDELFYDESDYEFFDDAEEENFDNEEYEVDDEYAYDEELDEEDDYYYDDEEWDEEVEDFDDWEDEEEFDYDDEDFYDEYEEYKEEQPEELVDQPNEEAIFEDELAPLDEDEKLEEEIATDILEDDVLPVEESEASEVIEDFSEEEFAYEEYSDELYEDDSYDAIVLIPSESNPPEEEVENVEENIEIEPIEQIAEELPAEIQEKTEEPSVIPEPTKPNTYSKYMVGGLSDLKSGSYYIQIAALSSDENILEIINKYAKNYPITIVPMAGGVRKQVMVGPLSMDEYAVVLERFKSYGYKDAFLRKIK